MSLNCEQIDFSSKKQFSKFQDVIRQEIKQKIATNPAFIEYSDNHKKIQNMRDIFAKINSEE